MIPQASKSEVEALAREFAGAKRVVVLTGAGCSTESGIPDYRGPNGTWTKRRPMYFQEFIHSAESRQYFWARNYRGWPYFAAAEPNGAHRALAALEQGGRVAALITQNVDDLHHKAGHQTVVDLHGQSSRVICLECRAIIPRVELQNVLTELNGDWWAEVNRVNPDGDAEIDRAETLTFRVPPCADCGGILKPDVVFFGESVRKEIVDRCMQEIERSDLLLVVGSSLAIWSGYRFALAAKERAKRLVLVNFGETRADQLADLKIEASSVSALVGAAALLGVTASSE